MSEIVSGQRKPSQGLRPLRAADQPPDTSKRIAELQVSAHLMTLETGLFCVFQSPGSPAPDPNSGLPGVRITPPPGIAGRPDAVSVSTFREDGWLNGTAALVRVADGSGQILVTIYQEKGKDAAPRLQVLRLSGEAGASAPAVAVPVAAPPVAAGAVTAAPVVKPEAATHPEVMAHIQRMGDVGCMLGDWLGSKRSGQWVEGFGLAPAGGIAAEDVEYQAVLGRDWLSPWVESGKFCGSRGMALPLLGLKVRLKGAAAKQYECSYSATFVDGSAVGPVSSGDACEAESLAALEAFQISIHPRSAAAATAVRATEKASPVKAPEKTAVKAPLRVVASRPAAKATSRKIIAPTKAATGQRAKSKR